MGGVLIEIDWHGKISALLGRDIPFEEIHDLWAASPAVNAFEHGNIDFDTFAERFIAEQELTLSIDEFKSEFMAIIIGEFEGIGPLLEALQKRFTISLLSNTNEAHWQFIKNDNTFLSFVDHPFTSIDFGVMKPAAEIYHRLMTELDCQPNEILFFDDGLANIEAARELGIHAERVYGPDDIRAVLDRYQ